MTYDLKNKRIWIAGHRGMVGGALVRRLGREGCEVVTAGRDVVDLVDQRAVQGWMARARPDAVVIAAARVGGIQANATRPVDFLYDNLMIEANIIHAAHNAGVERVLFLGSSCIYPKLAPQPIPEDSLLTGPLEPTNEWYAIAKIAGIKLIQAYRQQYGHDWISAMPTNLYGPGDNYDLETSHVLPALLRKVHEAKLRGDSEVVVWGSGTPLREFLHADDLADALVFLLKHYSDASHINVGSGVEVTIRELAEIISEVVGYEARLVFDSTKPDGTPRKLIDSGRLHDLGWNEARLLRDGIAQTYADWLAAESRG
ncbi:GDP-L-fucose synthase [Maritimibacter fusiformis]|uniref:GDP-L-fucose synthase n=1 Tax=Maritimibacter fusiformis TaxID=2603819 RepID=A0A5D0RRY4_9RHOB|nr:GDP-L-fucose synthase [Maritimibacter fusiformis]TYB83281.1 GDP-L-fucose synthase [Maritimibacter fusiformis]